MWMAQRWKMLRHHLCVPSAARASPRGSGIRGNSNQIPRDGISGSSEFLTHVLGSKRYVADREARILNNSYYITQREERSAVGSGFRRRDSMRSRRVSTEMPVLNI